MIYPMYVDDEITGLKVPNIGQPTQWLVDTPAGAEAIFNTRYGGVCLRSQAER